MDAKNSFEKQLTQAISQSKEALDALSKLKAIEYSSNEVSDSIKAELESISEQINVMMAELKEASVKALTLFENVNSLTSAKKNLDKFNKSLERFKSDSPGVEKR